MEMGKIRVNREFKNSVFIDIFGQDEYRLQLFQTLHPEMTDVTADDIQTITLKQVIINHQYNDLALLVKDRLMVFVEAQSSWSFNILIRLLLYLADTIQTYLHDREMNIHSSKLLKIPEPEFYVIYTGGQKVPGSISLSRDLFGNDQCALDLKAKVFTAETDDIIGQYVMFCRILDEQVKKYGRKREAAVEAIRICQDRGVLASYLREREKEVIDIMITLFDQEVAEQLYGLEQRQEGREEGREEGRIIGAIHIYRDEMNLDDQTILEKIIRNYHLDAKTAEQYILAESTDKTYSVN